MKTKKELIADIEWLQTKVANLEDIKTGRAAWIPVAERLPDADGYYLACNALNRVSFLDYANGWNCVRQTDGTIYRRAEIKGVTHWMPLPKPPERKGD